jgi:hypothetical protein
VKGRAATAPRMRANAIHAAVPPAVVRTNCVAIRNRPPQTVAACGRPRAINVRTLRDQRPYTRIRE